MHWEMNNRKMSGGERALPRSNRHIRVCAVILSIAAVLGGGTAGLAAEAAPSWPTYHGDASLCGVAGTSLPDKLTVLWRFKAGSGVSATPIAGGNMIFFVTDDGRTFAITPRGEKVWSREIDKDPAAGTNRLEQAGRFATPPLFVNNTVLAGTDDGWLYALEAATGKTRWKHKVGDSVKGSVNWMEPDGTRGCRVVAISQADGSVHCLDLASGQKLWASQPITRSDGSPGVGKDFIALGSCDAALHFLAATNGALLGSVALDSDGQVAGGVAVSGSQVFAGTRNGTIVCADALGNSVVWTNRIAAGEAFATPAVTADRVLAGSSDGFVYCLDNVLSPVAAGDKVVVSAGGTLYLLKLADGGKLWSGKAGDLISAPAVADGRVMVGTDDGFVIMYGAAAPAK